MLCCVQQQRHLVVAVDDSEEGEAAVAWVIGNLWKPGEVQAAAITL